MGRLPQTSKAVGHPKSEITKIKMLQIAFSYCKVTNTCCTDVIF